MEAFQYSPLYLPGEAPPVEPNRIRLLKLFSCSKPSNQISCELFHTDLRDAPNFEALSYCWGQDATSKHKLICNGAVLQVGTNAHEALEQLRPKQSDGSWRTLWIDAICINQDDPDNTERNGQVRIMHRIYNQSVRTVVWLGKKTEDSSHGVNFLRTLKVDILSRFASSLQSRTNPMEVLTLLANYTNTGAERIIGPVVTEHAEANPKGFKGMLNLLANAWFTRKWIIQELAVAKSAQFICGSDTIDWTEFYEGLVLCFPLFNTLRGTFEQQRGNMHLMTLASTRTELQSGRGIDLYTALARHSGSECKDARDHVFALLGLVAFNVQNQMDLTPRIMPDYGRNADQVFQDVTLHMISSYRNLDVLALPQVLGSRDPEAPSWSVRWDRINIRTVALGKNYKTHAEELVTYSAAGNSVPQLRSSPDGRGIAMLGLLLGTIDDVGMVMDLSATGDGASWKDGRHRAAALRNAVHTWTKVAKCSSKKHYPSGGTRLEAFLITILGGYTFENEAEFKKLSGVWWSLYRKVAWRDRLGLSKVPIFKIDLTLFADEKRRHNIQFQRQLMMYSNSRRMARLSGGLIGLVPAETAVGDSVVILQGGKTPFIVRKKNVSTWELIGAAYVHGVMNGEAYQEKDCEDMIIE